MADYADDAAKLIDHVGWETCKVIGVSFGGMVAQEFVLRHPGRATRLVLACTSSGGGGGASYPMHELDGMDPKERTRKMLAVGDSRLSEEWQKENPERVEEIIEMTLQQRAHIPRTKESIKGASLQLGARKHHDTFERLANIKIPTFLCGGKYDQLAPPENLKVLEQEIEGSTLKFYEGGHMFLVQDRQALRDIVEFLKSE
jgi:3-oxoadipate enol-lactonase